MKMMLTGALLACASLLSACASTATTSATSSTSAAPAASSTQFADEKRAKDDEDTVTGSRLPPSRPKRETAK